MVNFLMTMDQYCKSCMEKGEFLSLKFVMLNVSSGMWTCPKPDCVFPMNSPSLKDYMKDHMTTNQVLSLTKKQNRLSKKKKKSRSLSKYALMAFQDGRNSSLSTSCTSDELPSPTTCTTTSTRTSSINSLEDKITNKEYTIPLYPIWENKSLLCWLDSALSLLIFNQTITEEIKSLPITDSFINVLFIQYHKLIHLYRMTLKYNQIASHMNDMREVAVNYLQTKMLNNVEQDTLLLSLPLLLKTEKEVYLKLESKYSIDFSCKVCGFEENECFTQIMMSFPNTVEDLDCNGNMYFTRTCHQCQALHQKTTFTIEKYPLVMFAHFRRGVSSHQCWLDYNFTSPAGERYLVTQVIQYIEHKRHFVLWAYSHEEKLWLEADDLRDNVTSYKYKYPDFKPDQVQIMVWERESYLKDVLEKDAMVSRVSHATTATCQNGTQAFSTTCNSSDKTSSPTDRGGPQNFSPICHSGSEPSQDYNSDFQASMPIYNNDVQASSPTFDVLRQPDKTLNKRANFLSTLHKFKPYVSRNKQQKFIGNNILTSTMPPGEEVLSNKHLQLATTTVASSVVNSPLTSGDETEVLNYVKNIFLQEFEDDDDIFDIINNKPAQQTVVMTTTINTTSNTLELTSENSTKILYESEIAKNVTKALKEVTETSANTSLDTIESTVNPALNMVTSDINPVLNSTESNINSKLHKDDSAMGTDDMLSWGDSFDIDKFLES